MTFKKGVSGNPAGRKKNQVNKVTSQLRETLKTALSDEIESLPELLAECLPAERVDLIIKLIGYVMPKATSTESEAQKPSTDTAVLIAQTVQRLQAGSIAPDQARAELMAVDSLLKVNEQTIIMDKLAEIENKLSEVK